MAEKKAEKKVFDVAKPGKGKVEIGSKPMIVGHKSMASDPMMRNDKDEDKSIDAAPEKVSQSSKVTIVPVGDHEEAPEETVDSENTEGAPALPDNSALKSNLKQLEEVDTIEDHIVGSEEKPLSDEKVIQEDTKDDEQKDAPDQKNQDEDTKSAVAEEEKPVSVNRDTHINAASESAEEKKNEDDKELDPNAVAMERDENLQKLIDNKTYRLDIKESSTSEGRSKQIVVALCAILIGFAGLFVAIDTKTLDLGIDLPFSIFGKDTTATETPAPIADTTNDTAPEEKQVSQAKKTELTKPLEFSLEVPKDWKFSYSETSQGGSKFYTYVYELPSGTKLTFADSGGKGGDCTPDPADTPHKAGNVCMTTELIARKDLDVSDATQAKLTGKQALAIDKYRITTPNGTSRYFLCLDINYGDEQSLEVGKPVMGFGVQKCVGMGLLGYLTDITGPDNTSDAFFENQDVVQIEKVFATFELL